LEDTQLTAIENLKQYFGYDAFRNGQEALIDDILAGKDVLGIMPTGAGKSVCFQIPALMMSGITLIISPLISLMKDQVTALTQSGIAAAFINSSLNERQLKKYAKIKIYR
jgi:ATP-dependent DNA helicase RecQ